jgi:hypothetical protein
MKKKPIEKSSPCDPRILRFSQALSTKKEWQNLAGRLAMVIADLDEDEYLIISEKERNVYVQFAAQGFFGMRVEATSPEFFFESDVKFSEEEKKALPAMGWRKPTYVRKPDMDEPPGGSCNYYKEQPSPKHLHLPNLLPQPQPRNQLGNNRSVDVGEFLRF